MAVDSAGVPHTSSPLPASGALPRFGWMLWGLLAGTIWVVTLLRPDVFILASGARIVGRVVERVGDSLVTIETSDKPPARHSLERESIAEWYPFGDRSVTPVYHRAAGQWWRSEPLYTPGIHGFLYFPHAAILYSPFAFLPPSAEATLWRLACMAAYAAGIWRLSRVLFGARRGDAFLIASLLAIFPAIGSASNGQTNVAIGGLLALGAADLMDRRWWRTTLWLMLALACKPTALVMILLVGAIYVRPMAWRLAVGLAIFTIVPFLHPNTGYVLGQWRACLEKLVVAAAPEDLFQDIRGLLMSMSIDLPPLVLTGIRAAAAAATLVLCWLASRRFGDPARAMFLLTLAAIYLMLFSPRTEGVSYAILGPAAAIWGAREFIGRRWATAIGLAALCLILQFSRDLTGGANYWLRPALTLAFAGLVITEIIRARTHWPSQLGTTRP